MLRLLIALQTVGIPALATLAVSSAPSAITPRDPLTPTPSDRGCKSARADELQTSPARSTDSIASVSVGSMGLSTLPAPGHVSATGPVPVPAAVSVLTAPLASNLGPAAVPPVTVIPVASLAPAAAPLGMPSVAAAAGPAFVAPSAALMPIGVGIRVAAPAAAPAALPSVDSQPAPAAAPPTASPHCGPCGPWRPVVFSADVVPSAASAAAPAAKAGASAPKLVPAPRPAASAAGSALQLDGDVSCCACSVPVLCLPVLVGQVTFEQLIRAGPGEYVNCSVGVLVKSVSACRKVGVGREKVPTSVWDGDVMDREVGRFQSWRRSRALLGI